MTTKTYRVVSHADRDMSLVNLNADAVQDYWFDIEASSETETVGEFEVQDEYANLFERLLDNDPAVVEYARKGDGEESPASKRQWTCSEIVITPGSVTDKEDVDILVGSGDLQAEAWEALSEHNQTVKVYDITLYDEEGIEQHPMHAEALYIPDAGRIGITWGADAQWMDSTGDVEQDIEMWVNDGEQYAARN